MLVALLLCCCVDRVEPRAGCASGPVFVATVEPCQLAVAGADGPTTARIIRIAADDGMPWTRFTLGSAGRIVLFAERQPELVVAQLGPDLELEWSHRLGDGDLDIELGPHATSDAGLDLVAAPGGATPWLVHVDDDGACSERTELLLDGQANATVHSVVRDGDNVVLGGLTYALESRRAFIQRRTSTGALVAEVELLADYGYIERLDLFTGGPERYVAFSSEYVPFGIWSSSFGSQWFDESLALVPGGGPVSQFSLGYQNDTRGRLYDVVRDEHDYDAVPPPKSLSVARLASRSEPAGPSRLLTMPDLQCEGVEVTVRDEQLQVVQCNPSDELLGFTANGDPAWTAELSCPPTTELELGRMHFDIDGRLWIEGTEDGRSVVLLVEW